MEPLFELMDLEMDEEVAKVVVIGAPQVGKTTFIRAFYDHHDPGRTLSYNDIKYYYCKFAVGDTHRKAVIIEIPDGSEFYTRRHNTHAVVLMYAIDNPLSYDQLLYNLLPEASKLMDMWHIPVVLVGNKKDLRDDDRQVNEEFAAQDENFVTYDQGKYIFSFRNINDFSEISSNNLEEVNEVFDFIFNSLPLDG